MSEQSEPPRAWRVLLRLLPAWYAERYAGDLWQTHAEAHAARGRGGWFWARVTWDMLLTSVQLRSDALIDAGRRSHPHGMAASADVLRQQVLYAVRNLRRSPGFTLTVVLTLGLGIGATATLFAVLDRLLLSPPDHVIMPHAVHRVHVYGRHPFLHEVEYSAALTYPDYADLQGLGGIDAIAGYSTMELAVDIGDRATRVHAELATASYFPLLGVRPYAGRFFTRAEDAIESGSATVVLAHGFWQRAFGGDMRVLGRRLRIGKGTYEVIGIAPRGFTGADIADVDMWLPLHTVAATQWGTSWRDARSWWWLAALVRAPESRTDALSAQATRTYVTARAHVRGNDPNARVVLTPLIGARGPLATSESRVAQLLGGLAVLVLLIACANVANLLLARGVQRRRLLAIQTAIGITRARLFGQMILESALLALGAAALALCFTILITPALFRVLIPDTTLVAAYATRTVAFTALVALVATMLVGLLPALRSTRYDLVEALRSTRESPRGSAIRRGLLFLQAALATILVIGAGLFVRSLERAHAIDMGVDTDAVAITFELKGGARAGEAVSEVSYRALERVRALPFVVHAAATQLAQFQGYQGITVLVGRDTMQYERRPPFFYTATGGYFDALGLRIVRGRALDDADDRTGAELVAVISESIERVMFRDHDPLGTCIVVEPGETDGACTRIVGVVEDALHSISAEKADLNIYLPPHHPGVLESGAGVVIARTRGATTEQLDAIRAVAVGASPRIRLVEVNRLRNFLEQELRPWRMGAVLLSAFGILALLVAGAGLYSVLSFDVAQRRFELSVRAALGASSRGLVRAVMARALVICAAGVLAGAGAAVIIGRAAGALLLVSPFEPGVHAASLALLILFAVAGAALPARAAVRADPRAALMGN